MQKIKSDTNNKITKLNNYKSVYKNGIVIIKRSFFKHNDGLKTCNKISKLTDKLIYTLYKRSIAKREISSEDIIICAVGGYGREQLAPFSDLDILFIPKNESKHLESFIKKILYALWALGLKVGYAVRNIDEVIESSRKDIIIQTSLLDLRWVCGDKFFFQEVKKSINFFFNSNCKKKFIIEKIEERKKRLKDTKKNSYLLEPNIKECEGGLRDLNLIFWIFKLINKTNDLEILLNLNVISLSEKKKIEKSLDFILTVRCYIHFLSKRPNEKFTFDLQNSISKKMKYREGHSSLRVERLMQHYFLQIKNVGNLVSYFPKKEILDEKKKDIKNSKGLKSKGTLLIDNHIMIVNEFEFKDDLENYINIFLDSNKHEKKLHPCSYRFLCENLLQINKDLFIKKSISKKFKKLLLSNKVNNIFFLMNDCGLLSKIIPEFSNIIAQSQFDLYHVYTVDQHTLRALKLLKEIYSGSLKSDLFKHAVSICKVQRKKTNLFFSVLLHDIGKGLRGDHNKKGGELSKKITTYLNLSKFEINQISWLVENHLIFSQFAFNKDLEEEYVIKDFVSKVNSIEKLNALYLLTVVDIASVNEKTWNEWKAKLLKNLYEKSKNELNKPILSRYKFFEEKSSKKISLIKKKVLSRLSKNSEKEFEEFSLVTKKDFWNLQSIDDIGSQIDYFFRGSDPLKPFDCKIEFSETPGILDVTIVTKDKQNLLLNFIEKFIANKMEVLEARVFTLENNIVIDTFKLSAKSYLEFNDLDLKRKIKKLNEDLKKSSNQDKNKEIVISENNRKNQVLIKKTQISIETIPSKNYTIINVLTNDRAFLLFDILNVLLKNKLMINMAKISTLEDFVEDTFHVQKIFGSKILSSDESERIENQIKLSILKGR